ncbi:Copia protein [Symbiodinium microadriaticum]|uniref:Copia protein n=1 Tax=Symbiodinium microadriaticum TaxID=2951 RepID=A0A1Q9F7Q5_SYMMI|nr:Copia protein [Symbiodinium microadriaticum]
MAGGEASDPWTTPENDPWRRGNSWNTGEQTGGEVVMNEPNNDASAAASNDVNQSLGSQENGEAAVPTATSWQRDDWENREAEQWHAPKDASSDGGGSGDAATTASGRRASTGSGQAWANWDSWWQAHAWDQRASGWQSSWRDDPEPTRWTTAWPKSSSWWSSHENDGGPISGSTSGPRPPSTVTTPSGPTTRTPDGWMERGSAPREVGGGGPKGPSEKMIIPTFSGDVEGTGDLGTSARSYLRQIAAWEKMTKLAPDQRALVLYQNLQGSAWVNSESLCVDDLAQGDGVQVLKDWITQHYLDVEVTQVGRSLSDLFRKLKRKPSQTFRDYTSEFNRLLARVTECGCKLPDMATAWLYVDRASLDESTEVSLLASVGNRYALRDLQQAAIILDRSIRKPWERNSKHDGPPSRRYNSVNHTEEAEDCDHENSEPDFDLVDQLGEDTADLYVTYMTAKARYKDATKARGIDGGAPPDRRGPDPNMAKKAAEAKVQLAKSKSFCAACGQRGHWHRDAICPQRGKTERPQTVHVTNEIVEFATGGHTELYAILDSACSKSVVGTNWLERYLQLTRNKGYDIGFIYEHEAFKFGAASKIYQSSCAAVILVPIYDRCVAIKAAVIHGDIPLLMSRPALSKLGVVLDLAANTATFRFLGAEELGLQETSSGHPAIRVDHSSLRCPDVAKLPKDWEQHGIAVVGPREVYMTVCTGVPGSSSQSRPTPCSTYTKIFYDKKINPAIREMLVADSLNDSVFLEWWSQTDLTNDFWIETDTKLVRVHITPRKNFFNPQDRSLVDTRLCGSAEAFSTELKLFAPPIFFLRGMSTGPPTAPWKMNKAQLLQECLRRGLAVNNKWTCTELKTVLTADKEYANKEQGVPKGLSSMTLNDLRAEADRIGLEVGPKETRGSLMLRIRDAACPDDTVMVVGRFKGNTYKDIPENYAQWASDEERANGQCMSPDLKRFVQWRRYRRTRQTTEASSSHTRRDPEEYSVIPAPPVSETGCSASWAMVSEKADGYMKDAPIPPRPRASTSSSTAAKPKPMRRERSPNTEDRTYMDQDITEETRKEIEMLEGQGTVSSPAIGTNDTHHETFMSCSSGSEDSAEEVLITGKALEKLGDELIGVRPQAGHQGEQAALRAFEANDYSFETADSILKHYEITNSAKKRPGIHGESQGGRIALGYYAYGNFKGICTKSVRRPHLTKYLNNFLLEHVGGTGKEGRPTFWSSITVLRDCPAAMHTDKNNMRDTPNYVVSFGHGRGGGLWIEQPGGGVWRRARNGDDVEGIVIDTDQQAWEFNPRLRHASEASEGGRWVVAGYTARSFPNATKLEKRVLRGLDFPLGTNNDLAEIKKHQPTEATQAVQNNFSTSRRPRRSTRKALWKTAAYLSVMFSTVLAVMGDASREAVPAWDPSQVALMEIGGITATCRLAELSDETVFSAEPLLFEDILNNHHPTDIGFGYIEANVMRSRPRQLWVHVTREWGDGDIYHDLVEAVGLQLSEGRAVVFERNIDEEELWQELTSGWSEAGYTVYREIDEDGTENVRIIYAPAEQYVNEVFIGEDGQEPAEGAGHEGREPNHGPHEGGGGNPGERGAKAIKFPPSVPGRIASSLRRLHQNLGHPSPPDFTRHLRLAGASKEVLKAARGLECEVCQRCKAPSIPKPARIAPCLQFNQVVGIDLFYVHDSEGVRHQLLSMVDHSSGYHIVTPVAKKDTGHLERAFCEHWVNVFGAPAVAYVDMENGLEKSLARIGDWTGTQVRTAAGQAHFQAGYTERQGGIWKAIFARVNDEMSVCKSDIHLAVACVSSAKNNLTKTSGYSPSQHVFGVVANLPEDLLDGPHARSPNEEPIVDEAHARQVAIRTAARTAYFHVQTDERVRRALAGRTRVTSRRPETGERVMYYRKTKNAKRGQWVGPGTVIGDEGTNLWITRGGRCVLCAPEHVRLATAEELGQAFSLRAARDDLDRLLNADNDDEEVFPADEMIDGGEGEAGDADEDAIMADLDEMVLDHEEDEIYPRGQRRELERLPPVVLKRQRRKGRPDTTTVPSIHDINMIKKAKTERSREKQLEKEIPWSLIPEEMRSTFRAAEAKQWAEHVDSGALEVLTLAESDRIRAKVPPERILSSRYAYRDKHMGLRRINPETPWKAKARLVVAGHQDPDVGAEGLIVDSPTVARSSLLVVLQICASKKWQACAGDIQAAFLQGVELRRELWMALPRGGVDGLHPRQLARIRKGVFGLTESPRMWYDRLSGVLVSEVFYIEGETYKLCPSPLDPCILMLLKDGKPSEPLAYLAIHVDDILVVAPHKVNQTLREKISDLFPVDDWIADAFEYTGSFIKNDEEGVFINQANFVEGRLFRVDVPRQQAGHQPATLEQEIDNRSLIGALSWLGSQSRPDIQCGVALSQQLQRAPLTQDVRFVNSLTSRAEEHKHQGIYLRNIDLNRAMFVAFHDAAWANAELEDAEEGFTLTPDEIQARTFDELYTDQRPRKAKRSGSKVASQIGHLVMLFDYTILDGEWCRGSVLEWRSQSCKRVCRSTFGAETMAAVEGLEGAQYTRALLASLLAGRLVGHDEARRSWRLLCTTDCKSLFDYLHKAGAPKIPTDRRLAIDLAALRQELGYEKWTSRAPLQWIPTALQLADPLTKPMKTNPWWDYVQNGFSLPLKKGIFAEGHRCCREGTRAFFWQAVTYSYEELAELAVTFKQHRRWVYVSDSDIGLLFV